MLNRSVRSLVENRHHRNKLGLGIMNRGNGEWESGLC